VLVEREVKMPTANDVLELVGTGEYPEDRLKEGVA